jgi:hypothetical protein
VFAAEPKDGVGAGHLDLNTPRLRIAERNPGISDRLNVACTQLEAGLRLFHARLRNRNQAIGKSELALGVLSIEQCLLPRFLAGQPGFAGARAELASVSVCRPPEGDRPSPIPEGHREIET